MSNFEDFYNAHTAHQSRVCHVAYTLDDYQPVICTHIGDQPLFYFDEEIVDDESEEMFDPSELGFLSAELEILKQEIDGFNIKVDAVPQSTLKTMEEFSENAESFGFDFSITKDEQATRLKEITDTLEQSRLAAAYLNMAEKYNVTIMMSEQVEKAFYDRRSGIILLYPHMDKVDQILLVTQELRRHWQHRQGVLINPMTFQPEHAILVNRAQDADLAVSVIRTAWELQLAGIREVWERVEDSPMADLARAFSREAFLDFRTINDGTASSAVFEAWFLSDRCRQKDKVIIQSMLADYNGYVFENGAASENLTAELIATLGSMPFGKNYLSMHAQVVMDDPIFNEVRDRSSANFLWFIKFERSFKESEQHLQTESGLSTHDIRHDLLNRNSQDPNHERTQSADVIQLFEYQSEDTAKESGTSILSKGGKSRALRKGGAEIIDLKCWSTKQ